MCILKYLVFVLAIGGAAKKPSLKTQERFQRLCFPDRGCAVTGMPSDVQC